MTAAPAASSKAASVWQSQKRTIVPNSLTNPAITIDPGMEKFLPPLPEEDYNALKADIAASGVRDCLLVWRTVGADGKERLILIDGHNRYRAWEDLGKDPEQLPALEMEFDDRAAVEAWMIANQLMRRNLTDERRAYFRGLAYRAAKGGHGGDRKSKGQSEPLIDSGKSTADKLAEQFNVSASTVKRDAAFAKRVDALPSDEQRERVLSGKEKLPKVARPGKPSPNPEADVEATQEDKPDTPTSAAVVQTANFSDIMNGMVAKQLVGHIRHFLDGAIRVATTAPCNLSPVDAEALLAACGINELRAAILSKVEVPAVPTTAS